MSITKSFVLFLGACSVAFLLFQGCSSVPKDMLARIGDDTLRVEQYENMFLRTRFTPPMSMHDREQFLETLVDYRLKLAEAEHRGLHREAAFQEEMQRYRDDLALTFLYEKELIEPAVRKLFERRLEEVNLQHILIKWDRDEDGRKDTIRTYNRAKEIFEIVRNSSLPFDSLVMLYSQEGAIVRTKGVIGWFIAGTSFPELDDMMYSIQPGQIAPQMLRTVFGYHIFKLLDRKPARQRLRAAQILYRLDLENPNDTAAAYAHLSLVLDSLRRGLASFEELARRNSQDTVSGALGGDLGWVNRGTNLEAKVEETLFNLDVGEVSGVVRSPFGMHLLKVNDEEDPLPFEEQQEHLRRVYRNERFAADYLNFSERLREKYQLSINRPVVKRILDRLDTMLTTSTPNWDKRLVGDDLEAYVARTTAGPVTTAMLVDFIKREPSIQMRRFTASFIDTVAMMVADRIIGIAETNDFENRYPEFRRLLREYRESTLIGNLEDREIWGAISPDEAELRQWWEERREQFTYPPRVRLAEIFTYTQKQSEAYLDSLFAGADFEQLAGKYTQRTGYHSRNGVWDYMSYNENELAQAAANMQVGDIGGPIKFHNGFSLIKILDKEDARLQTFEEARHAAMSQFKEHLVEQRRNSWLSDLREKFDVKLYTRNLRYAFPEAPEGAGKEN